MISVIAAVGENRELGRGNDLIWRISDDLKRVKALTSGHPIIMGRKTYESIGKPLPNRTNIVISRSSGDIPGCTVVASLEEALKVGAETGTNEIFIFGGASIYEMALPHTHRLYLTLIHNTASDADVFFPDYSAFTKEIAREDHPDYSWVTLER